MNINKPYYSTTPRYAYASLHSVTFLASINIKFRDISTLRYSVHSDFKAMFDCLLWHVFSHARVAFHFHSC